MLFKILEYFFKSFEKDRARGRENFLESFPFPAKTTP